MMHKVFLFLIAAAVLMGGGSLLYIWNRFRRFEWMPQTGWKRNLLALLPAMLLLAWWIAALDGLVVIVHLAVIWLICDGTALLFRRAKHQHYYAGYLALTVAALYLGYGYIACHYVTETHYMLDTDKALGRDHFRIAMISDAHLGTTFNGKKMAEYLTEIEAQKPDILVIAGDLVDDGTKRNDWKQAAEALARFKTPLGKYFVFGNHDKGYYHSRDFSAAELVQDLEYAGVRVLQDETVQLTPQIELTGRCDRSNRSRKKAAELLAPEGAERYRILLDHQPADYAAEAAAGADLVLSGHTHGGQLWPLGFLSRSAANDQIYGLLYKNSTCFIVSSGISDWAISFKTGCKSEYVIIDINQRRKTMKEQQTTHVSQPCSANQFVNPVWKKIADPWITYDQGIYYGLKATNQGIVMQKADHPGKLENAPEHYIFKGIPGTDLACQFWAPELHRFGDKWYIYTTSSDGKIENHRVIVFESENDKPDSAYHFAATLTEPWGIDATVLTVHGKKYMVWAKADSGEVLTIAPMLSPVRLAEERAVIARPEHSWEGCILEGPVQLPSGPDGPVILVYSANDSKCDDYALAFLELTGDDPMNPAHWRKPEKPFMTKGNDLFGPGHCSFFTDRSGKIWIAMHVITESGKGWSKRAGWLQELVMDGNYPAMDQHPCPAGPPVRCPE